MDTFRPPAHVTITILPVSLSLVHIPRSRIPQLSRPILKQLLQPNSRFLNLTCNEIELSIFADRETLAEFEPVARHDRQRLRARDKDNARPSRTLTHRRQSSLTHDVIEPVEMSLETWTVIQVDSHEDAHSSSGSRVRELSAPLAAAGISILYQSSYMSDFIFVKASRLSEVIGRLHHAGFVLYPSEASFALTPFNTTPSDEDAHFTYDLPMGGSTHPQSPISFEGSMPGSRARSPSLASLTALSSLTMVNSAHVFADANPIPISDISTSPSTASPLSPDTLSRVKPTPSTRTPKKSLSPAAAAVDVLAPDLACVGLHEDDADRWSIKIMTLVGFPEMIPKSGAAAAASEHASAFDSAGFFVDSARMAASTDAQARRTSHLFQTSRESSSDSEGRAAQRKGRDTYTYPPRSSSDSPTSSPDSSDEDEYFSSASPNTRSRDDGSFSTPSLVSGSSSRSSHSLPDLVSAPGRAAARATARARPPLPHIHTHKPASRRTDVGGGPTSPVLPGIDERRTNVNARATFEVPFFSFTHTAEGSSLTTDVRVLASLFQPHERHMVICREELLEEADRANAADAPGTGSVVYAAEQEQDYEDGIMKCLQIDLHKYGLDKHGLVNRFSRVLEENGINHMYSSTYKTANLLVDKADAVRAQSLLRHC